MGGMEIPPATPLPVGVGGKGLYGEALAGAEGAEGKGWYAVG